MNDRDILLFASILIVALGALELVGILHFIPDCQVGWNLLIFSGCTSPITWYGLDPNIVAGAAVVAGGIALLVFGEKAVD